MLTVFIKIGLKIELTFNLNEFTCNITRLGVNFNISRNELEKNKNQSKKHCITNFHDQ